MPINWKMLICLTGKSGVGKSFIIDKLVQNGYCCYKIDQYLNNLYQKNQSGYNLIKTNFGLDYLKNNEVNRLKLRKLVTEDEKSLLKLEKLIWPLLLEFLKGFIDSKETIIIELAIFIKNPKYFSNIFDHVIYIKNTKKSTIKGTKGLLINEKSFPENSLLLKSDNIGQFESNFNKILLFLDNFKK